MKKHRRKTPLINEYQANPSWPPGPGHMAVSRRPIWHGKLAVHLGWVTLAQPCGDGEFATEIKLAGTPDSFIIKSPYTQFVRAWMRTKPIPMAAAKGKRRR